MKKKKLERETERHTQKKGEKKNIRKKQKRYLCFTSVSVCRPRWKRLCLAYMEKQNYPKSMDDKVTDKCIHKHKYRDEYISTTVRRAYTHTHTDEYISTKVRHTHTDECTHR